MSKSLTVNCGPVVLLKDRKDILGQYDSMAFNCGSVIISDSLYAKALAANAVFNCGGVNVIEEPVNPVKISGLLTLDENADYADCFVVCDNAVVTEAGAAKVDSLEGMIVLDTLYHPQSAGSATKNIRADKTVTYADDERLQIDDAWLASEDNRQWLPGAKYYVSGTVYALDADVLRALKKQGTSFRGPRVYLYESMREEFADILDGGEMFLIPDGYSFAKDSAPLMDLYATHGKNIYLLGDLVIQPRDARHLSLFSSIIVKNTANLPLEHLDACMAVVKADNVHVFEGELTKINGFQTISHAMLEAANACGTKYTMRINGFALFEEDVTIEDMRAIVSLHVNGAVSAPGATHGHLNGVGKINGAMLGSLSEIKNMLENMPGMAGKLLDGNLPGQLTKMLGIESANDGESSVINAGDYILM